MVKYLFEFSVEGTKYQRCDFENEFCDLIQNSNSLLSEWIRTVNSPGLKHDHKGNTSGTTLNFELLNTSTSCTYISSSLLFLPIGHFLSLVPSGGNITTADLISPVFLPSQTCKVPKTLLLEYVEYVRVCWEMQTQPHHNSSDFDSLYSWVSTIMLAQNMDIFRSLSRIMYRTRWQRCGRTQHCHSRKHGRGRWLCSPAITAFRCVTFIIYRNNCIAVEFLLWSS